MPSGIYQHKKGVHYSSKTEFKKGHKFLGGTGSKGKHWKIEDTSKMAGIKNLIGNKGSKGKKRPSMQGKNHPKWIKDRNLLKAKQERNDLTYLCWSRDVKRRDKNMCKINDKNCKGRLEVHHILSWKDYPELRYKINNGITLCQFHHPRKRIDEQKLIPYFQSMVEVIRT